MVILVVVVSLCLFLSFPVIDHLFYLRDRKKRLQAKRYWQDTKVVEAVQYLGQDGIKKIMNWFNTYGRLKDVKYDSDTDCLLIIARDGDNFRLKRNALAVVLPLQYIVRDGDGFCTYDSREFEQKYQEVTK